ncbi:MAG: AtpZ/AtpI family protein [Nitrospirae bacterium]|nr:AtpZ/AtpI family protein [Nitrospirota bacterium]
MNFRGPSAKLFYILTTNTGKKSSGEREKKGEFFRYLGVASTVGINLVISTFIGFALGYYLLDRFLNTFPWLTVIFTLLGIAAGFKYLFKIASKMNNDDKGSNGPSGQGSE